MVPDAEGRVMEDSWFCVLYVLISLDVCQIAVPSEYRAGVEYGLDGVVQTRMLSGKSVSNGL